MGWVGIITMIPNTTQYKKALNYQSNWLSQFLGKLCKVTLLSGTVYNILVSNTAPWIEGFYGEVDCKGTEHYRFMMSTVRDIYAIR
jgi:hypothetical protein